MIEAMATLRMTEAELARDIHAVLAKVQQGAEIVVEGGSPPRCGHSFAGPPGPNAVRVHRTRRGAGIHGDAR
jgi:hypothetical protein